MGGLRLERRAALCALLTCSLALVAASEARAESRAAWTQRALALQYSLASDVPLRNAPWVYTHNSFNSKAEMGPTLSDTDQNQQISITDQLDHGVRHLEIDTKHESFKNDKEANKMLTREYRAPFVVPAKV